MITIGVPPWASLGEDGVRRGVFPDIIEQFRKRTGHRIQESYLPFARLERELSTGTQDCGIFIWNESRASIVKRGETAYDFTIGVVLRDGVKATDLAGLRPLRLGVLRGLSIAPAFDGDQGLTRETVTDYEEGLRRMARGRLDGVAGMVPTIRHSAATLGLSDHLGGDVVLNSVPLVLQCSLNSTNLDVMEQLNQTLRDMRTDGTLAGIFASNYLR
jgi:polar amino acid transport system substrate-binding protein